MDINIKNENSVFKMRVAGIIIQDNKMLAVDVCDNGFYCLPGGHVHIGEDSKTAVLREIEEEVKINCKVDKLMVIMENFFIGKFNKINHELCYFYLLSPLSKISTEDFSYVENDEGVLKPLKFKWIDLEKIDKFDFRPNVINSKLKNKNFEFEHIINNETK